MKNLQTEVLVIGTGFGAAPVAMRMAQAGFQVTMIEKGPEIDPLNGFRQTQDPRYLLKYLKTLHGEGVSFNYIEGAGGGSGFYEVMSLRAPSSTFMKAGNDGRRLWPASLTREALDPYYDRVEKVLNVHQIDKRDVPKTGQVFSALLKQQGITVDRINYAERGCKNCGRCLTGCIYGAKQSMLITYLPGAVSAGADILYDTEALAIRANTAVSTASAQKVNIGRLPYRYIVECSGSSGRFDISAKMLVLAAGTLGTAGLLLRSRKNLPRLSDQVGRNMSFNGSVKMAFTLPDWCPDADMFVGRSNPGVVSYHFYNSHGIVLAPAKPLPLQIFGAARISRASDGPAGYLGEDHVALMKQLRKRIMIVAAFGYLPPDVDLTLDDSGDPEVTMHDSGAARDFYSSARALVSEIVRKAGAEMLNLQLMGERGTVRNGMHFVSSHQVGSCKMSSDKSFGVVNDQGEVFDYPGIYITDGSVLSSSLSIGPSLTIAANAERIAEKILTRYVHT